MVALLLVRVCARAYVEEEEKEREKRMVGKARGKQ
jgi:hypothetical protein